MLLQKKKKRNLALLAEAENGRGGCTFVGSEANTNSNTNVIGEQYRSKHFAWSKSNTKI